VTTTGRLFSEREVLLNIRYWEREFRTAFRLRRLQEPWGSLWRERARNALRMVRDWYRYLA
jgi:hypothetical protein